MKSKTASSNGPSPEEAETAPPSDLEGALIPRAEDAPAAKKKGRPKKEDDAEPEPENQTRLEKLMAGELIASIVKTHGKSIITKASEAKITSCHRIPTGIFELDYALGGGFPAGRVNIAWGMKSSGKTTMLTRALGQSQKMCANCYGFLNPESGKCGCKRFREHVCGFLDVEGTWDNEWAALQGVDVTKLLLSTPEYAEQTLDIAEALIRSTEVDLLVIDSIAFLTPSKEIEESSAKALQAEQARALGRGFRKFVSAINFVGNKTGRRPTMLFTNQVRHKIGLLFGNPETQPGGFAPGFAATTETKCWSGKYEMDETTGKPISVELNFRIEKNKSSGAKMEGKYSLMLSDTPQKKKGQIYDEPDIVELALKLGMIEKVSNQQWTMLGESYRGKSLIVQKMCDDPTFKLGVTNSLLTVLVA